MARCFADKAHRQILIFALGGPGSGKGSVCDRLSRLYHPVITTVSVGQLLRIRHQASKSDSVQRILNEGGVVPPEYSAQVLHSHLPSVDSEILLVDGFPRDVAAAQIWDVRYSTGMNKQPNALFFEAPDTVLRRRLQSRGRADDTPCVIERRLDFHRNNTPPLWDYMHRQGRAARIDASGSIDEVVVRASRALLKPPFNIETKILPHL